MNEHDPDAVKPPPQALLMSTIATAESLGISERTLWSLTANGDIPHVRIGRRVMFRPEALRAWVLAREQRGSGPADAEHRD